jgi:hypothetical protein
MEKCSIIWLAFGPLNPLPLVNSVLEVEEQQNFPVYVSGKELEEFENKRPFSYTAWNILVGSFLGFCDRPYMPMNDPRPLIMKYLERFSAENNEKMIGLIMNVSDHLREVNGNWTSRQVLLNYLELDVDHSVIMNNLLVDTWECLKQADDSNFEKILLEFYALAKKANENQIQLLSKEWFDYAFAVTLVYLDINKIKYDENINTYLDKIPNDIARGHIIKVLHSRKFETYLL